jgi:hypothetical protein
LGDGHAVFGDGFTVRSVREERGRLGE